MNITTFTPASFIFAFRNRYFRTNRNIPHKGIRIPKDSQTVIGRLCKISMSIFVVMLIFAYSAFSQTELSGEIRSGLFDVNKNLYIITGNIVVPSGNECTIPAGCVLLFKPFTSLTVEDVLHVNGTIDRPVIFSTVNNDIYNSGNSNPAAPFDWNGIIIAPESKGTSFNYTLVEYSVFGIKSETPDITLNYCTFNQNGQYRFTIKHKIQEVIESVPFTYQGENSKIAVQEKKVNVQIEHAPEKKSTKPRKRIVRISSLSLGILSFTAGAILYNKMESADRQIQSMKPDKINPETGTYYKEAEVQVVNNKRRLYSIGVASSSTLGGIGFGGFILTLIF